jgi:DNA-binding transcriptional LysR family regulator
MTRTVDLQLLRLFVAVADHGNISHAAAALGLSQPSVSRGLQSLEQLVEAPLFHRTGRGVSLTQVGQQAVIRARDIVGQSDGFVREIRDLSRAPGGTVTVALLTTYMHTVAADLFDEVRERFPGITLRMLESFSVQHEDWLASGRVDIALVATYRPPRLEDGELLATSNLVLLGHAGLAARPGPIRFRDLAGLPLVLPAAPNGLRVRMDDVARRLGIRLNVVFEADSIEAQAALVRRKRCHAVWSESTAQSQAARLMVNRIVQPSIPRYVVMRTTTHHPLERAAREVAQILRRLIVDT